VVFAVLVALNPDLLILGDYSMGLDAGYRTLKADKKIDFAGRSPGRLFGFADSWFHQG